MEVLFILLPLSVTLIFGVLAVLCWAVFAGQFEDLDTEASRVLDDEQPLRCIAAPIDLDQSSPAGHPRPSVTSPEPLPRHPVSPNDTATP